MFLSSSSFSSSSSPPPPTPPSLLPPPPSCPPLYPVNQVVPLLKQVMARMLPMLGATKVENMQWAFSSGERERERERGVKIFSLPLFSAIARFCEAIGDYLADEQRAAASGITSTQFEGEVFSAYDQLFNLWLGSKEARVRVLL